MTDAECILEGTSLQEALKDFDPTMTQPIWRAGYLCQGVASMHFILMHV
jgi:hypothetical protein